MPAPISLIIVAIFMNKFMILLILSGPELKPGLDKRNLTIQCQKILLCAGKGLHMYHLTHATCQICPLQIYQACSMPQKVCLRYSGQSKPDLRGTHSVQSKYEKHVRCSPDKPQISGRKIGPPRVDIKRREEQVTVDIFHPEVIVNGEVLGIMFDDDSVCHTFDYRVYVRRNRTGDILFTKHVLKTQDCSETECQLNITVTSLDFEYCVSVEGISDSWELTTEKSKEACISLSHNSIKGSVWIPIVAAFVLLFLIVIVGFAYWHLKKNPLKKQSMILPKSLLSVVRNATSETKPESKYISLITSCQPLVPENETVLSEEPLSPVTTPDNPGEAEHGEHSIETEVVIMEGSTSDLTPDSPPTPIKRENSSPLSSNQSEPCTITLNSYHSRDGSDSGLVGSGSFISDSEFPPPNKPEIKTEEQESTAVRKAPTSFGYDKPHVLVDVIVDGGEKESLIGYRLTARAKELS
ncbi:interferon gamma receptor 1 isoform X2 [Nannospalax galili]|uniref:interferon gamma receptor 1 isoform X2 n=1 Tax=Nannospalax galili TaxID=1026970 RepID=UPI00111C22FF|nr:interferon gamma receptor 1 isoform X2 [Nannospalax galili]